MAILFPKKLAEINRRLEAERARARSPQRRKATATPQRRRRPQQVEVRPVSKNLTAKTAIEVPSHEVLDAICDVLDLTGTSSLPKPVRRLQGELHRYLATEGGQGSRKQLIDGTKRIAAEVRNQPLQEPRRRGIDGPELA